jgi:RNA polymerase sigma-70 factor (ECF subfamily)
MADPAARPTPPSLLLRIRDVADEESWRTFEQTYAPLVFRYCRRHGLQHADADDVTQEVLAAVARAIRSFDYQPQRGRFRDWLGAVTRSRLARFHARRGKEVKADPGDAPLEQVAGPADDPEWAEQFNARVLESALERIRPHFEAPTWQAFEGSWLRDRPAADVAAELAMPVAKVYVARSRVLKRLREEVALLAEDLLPGLSAD